jgi:hypothetical protein
MLDLLSCRWREVNSDGTLRCHSGKYLAPPNPVDNAFCGQCCYRDHETHPALAPEKIAGCKLRAYERRVHSQNGEDGIIAEILRRTGTGGLAVELGAHCDFGNCYLLAQQNYPVLFVERDPVALGWLAHRIHGPNVSYKRLHVTAENINLAIPSETAILSIDIDGNDYWIWKALRCKPNFVVIEFNHVHRPPARKVIPYDANFLWDGTTFFGASLSALRDLGREKGYILVATDSVQCNAYFVLSKFAGRFQSVNPKQLWYDPGWTHRASDRNLMDV